MGRSRGGHCGFGRGDRNEGRQRLRLLPTIFRCEIHSKYLFVDDGMFAEEDHFSRSGDEKRFHNRAYERLEWEMRTGKQGLVNCE